MNEYQKAYEKLKEMKENGIELFGRVIGKGAYGQIRDVKLTSSNKIVSAKLIEKKKEIEKINEIELTKDLRGYYIIKIILTSKTDVDDKNYFLIVMEKALLRDLGKLNEFYHNHNLLKLILIDDTFIEKLGDNLLRFYALQIIKGLEILDEYYYVHFDLKPENLLMNLNLELKISDFDLLTKVKDPKDGIDIPGGTPGYLTPEYYLKDPVTEEVARKQDYFALGAILYFIKFGMTMLKYQKYEEKILNADRIVDLLERQIMKLKSNQTLAQDFIDFITKLIQPDPNDRPVFEQIYRNKWLNKNKEVLEEIFAANDNDEEKLIMELQKSDFLISKKNINKKEKRLKFIKKNV